MCKKLKVLHRIENRRSNSNFLVDFEKIARELLELLEKFLENCWKNSEISLNYVIDLQGLSVCFSEMRFVPRDFVVGAKRTQKGSVTCFNNK